MWVYIYIYTRVLAYMERLGFRDKGLELRDTERLERPYRRDTGFVQGMG